MQIITTVTQKGQVTLPKKMSLKAKESALAQKAKEGLVTVVSGLNKIAKTSEAQKFLDKVSKENITLALSESNKQVIRYFRNIKNVSLVSYKNLNAYDVYWGGHLLIDEDAITKPKKQPVKKT